MCKHTHTASQLHIISKNGRRLAKPHHRNSTFPASARTAVWLATLLTLELDSAEVSLSRYGIVAARFAKSLLTVNVFRSALCKCHRCDMLFRIGRSYTQSVMAHPVKGSSVSECIRLLFILRRRYLAGFLCRKGVIRRYPPVKAYLKNML